LTEPKLVTLIESVVPYANHNHHYAIVKVGRFAVSLQIETNYEDIRFYDEHRNNFATVRFNYFGEISYYVYEFGSTPSTKDKLFNCLESMSDSFVEWLLWNPIL
jgi:hypothetical protein